VGYHQLTQDERYAMGSMIQRGYSFREIALVLGRSPSTISRERRRNATTHDGHYRHEKAHQYAMARRRRTRKQPQYSYEEWTSVEQQLRDDWSPQQIAGRARLNRQQIMSVQTMYRYIKLDRREGGDLWRRLRIVSKFARKRRGSPATRGRLAGKRHISERPACVEKRRVQGHWEGDTVMGSDLRHCVLTLVERVSGFTIIKKLIARSKEEAAAALKSILRRLNARVTTITLDNGTEFHDYAKVEAVHPVKFYFANPYHSWERGTNENTNGLIRQYLPKGSCFKQLTQEECDQIANKLNDRPRLRLGFETPNEVFVRS
jgi:transposase, IS30 family